MHRALLVPLAMLTMTACSRGEASRSGEPATVEVTDAVCRPTPVGRKMTGCYLTLTAGGADRLLSVSSADASRVQIHDRLNENTSRTGSAYSITDQRTST